MEKLYLSHISPWAPGLLDDKENWQKWANGESNVQIEQTKDSPKLEYTDPLFRRRLSQISKMTIHTIHNLIESINSQTPDSFDKETKIPCHCFNEKTKAPLGIYGWGRGCAWWAIGITDSLKALM